MKVRLLEDYGSKHIDHTTHKRDRKSTYISAGSISEHGDEDRGYTFIDKETNNKVTFTHKLVLRDTHQFEIIEE
jgi:hypothetical protein